MADEKITYIKKMEIEKINNNKIVSAGVILLIAFFGLFMAFYNSNNCKLSANVNPTNFCSGMTITINNAGSTSNFAPVRVPFIGSGLQSLNYMDNLGSQLLASEQNLTNINFMNQDINSSSSQGYWFTINSLNNGNNVINFYLGANDTNIFRDNGVYFYTEDLVTIPNDTAFNIGDNLSIVSNIYLNDLASWSCPLGVPTIDQGFILDRWDSNTGYALGVECEQGVLYNFALIDSTKVRSAVTTDFGTPYKLKMEYISPNINLYVDDVLVNTGTSGSLSSFNNNLTMGNGLNNSWILNLVLSKNITTTNSIELNYNFDPTDLSETSFPASGEYAGSVADTSGNGHDGTYLFKRDQSPYTITLGVPTNIGIQNFVENPDVQRTLTNPLSADIQSVGDENTFFPFFPFLNEAGNTSGIPRGAIFGGMFSVLAMISAGIVVAMTRKVPFGILTYSFIMYIGLLNNFYNLTFTLITISLLILLYGSSKFLGDKL